MYYRHTYLLCARTTHLSGSIRLILVRTTTPKLKSAGSIYYFITCSYIMYMTYFFIYFRDSGNVPDHESLRKGVLYMSHVYIGNITYRVRDY